MAGFDPQIVTGASQPTLTTSPTAGGAMAGKLSAVVQPHHGLIGLVLFAVLILWALDKFGFRFAVTVGRS